MVQRTAQTRDRLTLYDPNELPELYAATGRGTCLEPEFQDGDCVAFSKSVQPKSGDIVSIWFRPGVKPPGEPQQWLKRLLVEPPPGMLFPFAPTSGSEFVPVIIVEQLNPPRSFTIRCTDILAIHKCIGKAEPGGNGKARFRWKEARP